MKNTAYTFLLFAISSLTSSAFASPITFIEMESIGAYVVPKGSYYYDNDNSQIQGYSAYSSNPTYYQNSLRFRVKYDPYDYYGYTSTKYWSLGFSTHELGGPMQVGVYDNAVRFPFEPKGTPGISITGNGRGNNTLTGSFEVLDIAFQDNSLLRFAATFEQNNSIFGKISYNSEAFSTPTPSVPEPPMILLLLTGLLSVGFRKLYRK